MPSTIDDIRTRQERLAAAIYEKKKRDARALQSQPVGGLIEFVRYFWRVLEPVDEFVEGWPIECLCAHLEAITRQETVEIHGEERPFNRFLANVPPGFMKSLLVNVFWPAWEWGPMGLPHLRYVAFSYAAELTERDNAKFRNLVVSREYQELWSHVFTVVGDGKVRVTNDKTGFKFASSFGGVGTGERGHRVLFDDPHKLKGTAETDEARDAITNWFREGMQNRLNDLKRDVIVVIMQRVHENDTSGAVMTHLGNEYCHLIIPMEYESNRHFSHYTGWNDGNDPRTRDGQLAWVDRYGPKELASFKRNAYLWSGQYQQNPIPRGGGIFKESWWQTYEVPPSKSYDFTPLFVLASLDTAFKEGEQNDYNALTVWAVYDDALTKRRRMIMVDAWQKRLPLHGERVERKRDEPEHAYQRRAQAKWGLVEWVNHTCTKRRVTRLIIEDASRGHDLNAEIQRLYSARDWGVHLVPARGDKWSRASAVVDLFTDEMIYAPAELVGDMWQWREWAAEVITQMCSFPRGTHDDLVDSVVMALLHLRQIGLAIRREERDLAEEDMARHRPASKPLYSV